MAASHPRPWQRHGARLVMLAMLAAVPPCAADESGWSRAGWYTDYEQALTRARSAARPVFVYFDAAWCSWCQQYRRDTLDQPRVIAALRKDYIAVVVDYDTRPELFQRYGGKGLPFTVILAADGHVLNRFVGLLTTPDLLDVLARFAAARPAAAPPDTALSAGIAVGSLDWRGYNDFRRAFLDHIESLYRADSGTLSGRFETGATLKRPSPLTWMYLLDDAAWRARAQRAASAEAHRLLDRHDGGFFSFLDPARFDEEYLETSKLLESNAWLSAWLAQVGRQDRAARNAARRGWIFLRDVLWDAKHGGFWQAQVADNRYYALSAAARKRTAPPPLDRSKRADTNAQAVLALLRYSRFAGDPAAAKYAADTLDFILGTLLHNSTLFHILRDGRPANPDLPQDWFWVLAAGAELEARRPDKSRHKRLTVIAERAGEWLSVRMGARDTEPLTVELAGLIAWVGGRQDLYPSIPEGTRAWALRQLRIETDTPPDDVVFGLMAWEQLLSSAQMDTGKKRSSGPTELLAGDKQFGLAAVAQDLGACCIAQFDRRQPERPAVSPATALRHGARLLRHPHLAHPYMDASADLHRSRFQAVADFLAR